MNRNSFNLLVWSCSIPVLFFCFVSFFNLWVPGLSPLLFSLISSLISILSLARFYALEDVLSTEYNPGLLYNQISCEDTHTHKCAHMRMHTRYTRAHTTSTLKLFYILYMNTTTKATNIPPHAQTRECKMCTHTHTHGMTLPCHSSSGIKQLRVLHLCALCWHTTTAFRFCSAQTEELSVLFDQNKAFVLKYSYNPMAALGFAIARSFLHVSQILLYLSHNKTGRTHK